MNQNLTIKTLKTWRDYDGGVAWQATLALNGRTVGLATYYVYTRGLSMIFSTTDTPRWNAYLASLPPARPSQNLADEHIKALVDAFESI